MKRLLAAALVAGGISASVSTAQATTIGIDFGCGEIINDVPSCTLGDAPLQDGYLSWTGPQLGTPLDYNETRSFSSDFGVGGSFDLNVTSDGLYFRDYSALTGTYASQSDLLSDNILRNSPGSIVFTFSGLTAGTYSMESFHHDSVFGSTNVPFTIEVMGSTLSPTFDTSGGTSPSAITTALYAFTVGAGETASITFDTDFADLGEHMSINGFQLTYVAPVPLPAGVWLLLSALGGLGLAGWRRKRVAA